MGNINRTELVKTAQKLGISTIDNSEEQLREEIRKRISGNKEVINLKIQKYKLLDEQRSVLKASADIAHAKLDGLKKEKELKGTVSGLGIAQSNYDEKYKAANDKRIAYEVAFSGAQDSVFSSLRTGGMFA